jgi:hypothetical protein
VLHGVQVAPKLLFGRRNANARVSPDADDGVAGDFPLPEPLRDRGPTHTSQRREFRFAHDLHAAEFT